MSKFEQVVQSRKVWASVVAVGLLSLLWYFGAISGETYAWGVTIGGERVHRGGGDGGWAVGAVRGVGEGDGDHEWGNHEFHEWHEWGRGR